MVTATQAVLLLVLFTFLPALVGASVLRSAERVRPPPWRRVLAAFLFGAVVAVVVSAFGEEYALARAGIAADSVLLALVIAPVVEECSKALGLFFFHDPRPLPENGYVYGGAVGLGFAASENLLYVGGAFLTSGQDAALQLGLYRGIATVSLHAAATAFTGYGIWRFRFARGFLRKGLGLFLFPFSLATAIVVHATYNAIASVEAAGATLVAVVFAVLVFSYVRRRIRRLERRALV